MYAGVNKMFICFFKLMLLDVLQKYFSDFNAIRTELKKIVWQLKKITFITSTKLTNFNKIIFNETTEFFFLCLKNT